MARYATRHLRALQAERRETLVYPDERVRSYACTCGYVTVTAAIADGDVPPDLGCRREQPGPCGLRATLQPEGTDIPSSLGPPRWEWYAPDIEQMQRAKRQGGPLWEHIHRGGLLLRRRRRSGP